jgi:hypothetical protein
MCKHLKAETMMKLYFNGEQNQWKAWLFGIA